MTKIEEFRQACASRTGNRPYSRKARELACSYARSELAKGVATAAISGRLGVNDMTLRSWLFASKPEPAGSLREVVVSEVAAVQRSSSPMTLTTAQGHVLSGLDVATAAELLRALS